MEEGGHFLNAMCFKIRFRHFCLSCLFVALPLTAQTPALRSDPAAMRLASLEQDIQLLQRQTGQLTLELENARREIEALRRRDSADPKADAINQLAANLRAQFIAEDQRNRLEIVEEVKRLLERYAQGTRPAAAPAAKAEEVSTVNFTDDYPKEGVPYTVQKGDTLSDIARKMNSTVKDIQNANRISDPKTIKVGQTLFIPQGRGK